MKQNENLDANAPLDCTVDNLAQALFQRPYDRYDDDDFEESTTINNFAATCWATTVIHLLLTIKFFR